MIIRNLSRSIRNRGKLYLKILLGVVLNQLERIEEAIIDYTKILRSIHKIL